MAHSRVSRKFQLTLPAQIRRALGIKAGDRLEVRAAGDHIELRKVRPNVGQVIEALLAEFDFRALSEETGGDAAGHVRRLRWGDDQP